MSRNEPVIRERTAITVPVQNLYVKNNQLKRRKNAYALHYVSKTQPPCVHPISGTDATHAVANPHGMGKGELRLALTLNGQQRQPSALAKHSRQPLLCPFGDTSLLP